MLDNQLKLQQSWPASSQGSVGGSIGWATLADSTLPYVSKKSRSLRSLVSWFRLPTNMVPMLSSRLPPFDGSRSTLRPPLDRGDGLGDADIELWL